MPSPRVIGQQLIALSWVVQLEKAESSAGSTDALHIQSPGSALSATSPPGSDPCSVSAAGVAAATDIHCSASSCCSEPSAAPEVARKPRQGPTSAASVRSADEDDDVSSIGSLKCMVRSLDWPTLTLTWKIRSMRSA